MSFVKTEPISSTSSFTHHNPSTPFQRKDVRKATSSSPSGLLTPTPRVKQDHSPSPSIKIKIESPTPQANPSIPVHARQNGPIDIPVVARHFESRNRPASPSKVSKRHYTTRSSCHTPVNKVYPGFGRARNSVRARKFVEELKLGVTPVPGDVGVPNGAVLDWEERRMAMKETVECMRSEVYQMSSGEIKLRKMLGKWRTGGGMYARSSVCRMFDDL